MVVFFATGPDSRCWSCFWSLGWSWPRLSRTSSGRSGKRYHSTDRPETTCTFQLKISKLIYKLGKLSNVPTQDLGCEIWYFVPVLAQLYWIWLRCFWECPTSILSPLQFSFKKYAWKMAERTQTHIKSFETKSLQNGGHEQGQHHLHLTQPTWNTQKI